ncbi:MAG: dTMP kinase [Candidatus Paracaedibacteraceae bacterium]|nr:dTMP kinase [Candidatus Paracaedibacteraceae bacterium]
MTKGIFISLEGGEGSGKSTLARKLKEFLESKNIPVLLTREPGGTLEAEAIRSLVVEGENDRFDPIVEALLFNAARRHHLMQAIIPALDLGCWVICDRFVDSTFVYQGFVQNVDLVFLKNLHRDACKNIFPNVTFLLDVPVDVGLYRANKRQYNEHEARFEKKGYLFHEAVRKSFLDLSKDYADRYYVLDSTLTEFELFKIATECLSNLFIELNTQ